ncbi:unnamed protein product [Closterium sp. Naga37s-1]|nr:unnamed protein product [Closterium sp. Naga37s-1]
MVIAGGSELSPVRTAAPLAVVGMTPSERGTVTIPTKPPVPPAPRPATTAAEIPRPLAPADPVASVVPPKGSPTVDVPAAPLVAPPTPVCLGPDPPALVVAPHPPAPVGAVSVPAVPAPLLAAGAPAVLIPVGAPAVPNPAVGSSPRAVSTTTGGPGLGESGGAAPPIVPALSAVVPQTQRPPSPGGRRHRPHSPAPRDERERSRRRHDSPRRHGSQANWAASRGGRGGWWGGRGRGGDWAYDRPVSMADLQRVVSAAVREERNGHASQSNSPRGPPSRASPPPVAAPPPATPLPRPDVPPAFDPAASAAAPGNRMRLPWIPPVAGIEFVTAAGGPVTAQYPSLLPVGRAPPAAAPLLWRLSEGLRAVHLIQVYGHAALSQGVSLDGGPRDECLDAADRLAELLAPVLAAPARGGVAGVGQLGTALRGLRRFLRTGTPIDLIGATTVVVRELHRSLTGLLAVLDADRM